jgi:hypothetical protein
MYINLTKDVDQQFVESRNYVTTFSQLNFIKPRITVVSMPRSSLLPGSHFVKYLRVSRGSSVSIVSDYGVDYRVIGVRS